jgi:hypothetical protein
MRQNEVRKALLSYAQIRKLYWKVLWPHPVVQVAHVKQVFPREKPHCQPELPRLRQARGPLASSLRPPARGRWIDVEHGWPGVRIHAGTMSVGIRRTQGKSNRAKGRGLRLRSVVLSLESA